MKMININKIKNLNIILYAFVLITIVLFFVKKIKAEINADVNNNSNIQDESILFISKYPIIDLDILLNNIGNNITNDITDNIHNADNVDEFVNYNNYNFIKGWVTDNVNDYIEPTNESSILETYNYNKEIKYAYYDENWSVIKYDNNHAFIQTEYISNEKCNYRIVNIPKYNLYKGMKTWMPYTTITYISSPQYKLQTMAYTGEYGIRMYDGRFCVAVGTGITSDVGTYIDIVLENGYVIPCIVGDIKADIHTESMNFFTNGSNCCSEFIVDINHIDPKAKTTGDFSNVSDKWDSKVAKVKVYDHIDIVDW